MKARYFQIIFNVLFIGLITVFQISFISNLPSFLGYTNALLVILLFILVMIDFEKSIWWAIGFGVIMDIYSFLPFGFYLASFIITLVLINFLFVNFFTDKSLYSFLALGVAFTLSHGIIINILVFFNDFFWGEARFFLAKRYFWINLLEGSIANLMLIIFLFYINSFISNRLKPVFLIKAEQKNDRI